ncbi:MAG: YrbL family protein [Desulfurivibrionaceae bacterium]
MITSADIEKHFAADAELLSTGYRREVFLFRNLVVKRIYRGYKRAKDLNYHELRNYKKISAKLPEELKINFQTVYQVLEAGGQTYLITEAILDDNGKPSKSIEDLGALQDREFWERLEGVVSFLAEADLCLTDIHRKNVLVRKKEGQLIPVIVDYKTMGKDFAPWQIELFFRIGRVGKMYRKYSRMKREFMAV